MHWNDIVGLFFPALMYFLPGFVTAKVMKSKSCRETLAWTLLFTPMLFCYIPYRMMEVWFEIISEGWAVYKARKDARDQKDADEYVREMLGIKEKS